MAKPPSLREGIGSRRSSEVSAASCVYHSAGARDRRHAPLIRPLAASDPAPYPRAAQHRPTPALSSVTVCRLSIGVRQPDVTKVGVFRTTCNVFPSSHVLPLEEAVQLCGRSQEDAVEGLFAALLLCAVVAVVHVLKELRAPLATPRTSDSSARHEDGTFEEASADQPRPSATLAS